MVHPNTCVLKIQTFVGVVGVEIDSGTLRKGPAAFPVSSGIVLSRSRRLAATNLALQSRLLNEVLAVEDIDETGLDGKTARNLLIYILLNNDF